MSIQQRMLALFAALLLAPLAALNAADLAANAPPRADCRPGDGIYMSTYGGNRHRAYRETIAAVLELPYVAGVVHYMLWKELEPTNGVYDWRQLDDAFAEAKQHHKRFAFGLIAGMDAPAWVMDSVKTLDFTLDKYVRYWKRAIDLQLEVFTKSRLCFATHNWIYGGPYSTEQQGRAAREIRDYALRRYAEVRGSGSRMVIRNCGLSPNVKTYGNPDTGEGVPATDYAALLWEVRAQADIGFETAGVARRLKYTPEDFGCMLRIASAYHGHIVEIRVSDIWDAEKNAPYAPYVPALRTAAQAMGTLLEPSAALPAADALPPFSWEHVPLYAHFGYDANLRPEQYDFLAKHFSLVTIAAGRVHENAERGIAAGAAEIKKRNPAVKVLFYWPTNIPHGPFTVSQGTFPQGGYLDVLRRRPNGKGMPMYDHSSAEMRAWWSGVAGRAVREYSCDGIFADGTHPLVNRELSKEKVAAANAGLVTMLKDAHAKMGAGKLIIFNALHGEEYAGYLAVTDGAMIDRFDRDEKQTKETMAADLEAMRKAARAGKIICFKAWPGFTMKDKEMMQKPHDELARIASEQITFSLACFLVAAGNHCYFQYTWGWDAECGTFDRHPEFAKPLGEPKGEAKRDGWTYAREFAHASVSVNLETKTARIDWKP